MLAPKETKIGVIIPCCEEAQNIGDLLQNFSRWHAHEPRLHLVAVVLAPSSDGTHEIVTRFRDRNLIPMSVIFQAQRQGKAQAINLGLEALKECSLIILCSGDVQPLDGCLSQLVRACEAPQVGLCGGRVVPKAAVNTFAAQISRFHWAMHHAIASRKPKSTEVTVFKNGAFRLDDTTHVDEAEIERHIQRQGLKICYVAEAQIATPAPVELKDYFMRRLGVTKGHLHLERLHGFSIGTLDWRTRFQALREIVREQRPTLSVLVAGIFLEALVWGVARASLLLGQKSQPVWERAHSTKYALHRN